MATACTATTAEAGTNMPEHVEPELVELIMGNIAAVTLLEEALPTPIPTTDATAIMWTC